MFVGALDGVFLSLSLSLSLSLLHQGMRDASRHTGLRARLFQGFGRTREIYVKGPPVMHVLNISLSSSWHGGA